MTDASRIWMPDTFFRNEKIGAFHTILQPNLYIRIYPDGTVLYSIRCSLSLEWNVWRFNLISMQSFSYCFLLHGSRPFPLGRTNLSSVHCQLWVKYKYFIFLFSGSVFYTFWCLKDPILAMAKSNTDDKVDITHPSYKKCQNWQARNSSSSS